ncbi:MAG: PD40 domain-containing protein [Anaerolineae bacterium]|nr:PD40 domain-containing protein [Anaerolineae bacterium]
MNLFSRLPSLTTILWIVASLVAFGAFIYIAPNLINPPTANVTPTNVVVVAPTTRATPTMPSTGTPIAIVPPPKSVTTNPLPTPPEGAEVYTSIADPTRSGYLKLADDKPHWGDRNLHAGYFGNDRYASALYFDVSAIPPNSEILSAQIELAGLSRDNLGSQGEWRASLVRLKPFAEWQDLTTRDFFDATVTTSIDSPLGPGDLDLGRVNELQFLQDQLPGLSVEIDERTFIVVRLDGPLGPDNSLFTWDSGGLDLKGGVHPTLRVVARPGQFVVVTNTPTPVNVVTAAAIALAETDFATRFGTATPFPRSHATGTPIHLVTRQFTPSNVETRVAIAQVATAIAVTTGTYTPTPENWIEVTPTFTPLPTRTPLVIPAATLFARLTPTAPPINTPTVRDMLAAPLPDFLKGNLLVRTNRFGQDMVVVMQPDGTITQALTGQLYYIYAEAREPYSPDRQERVVVAPDERGILQIWVENQETFEKRPITTLSRGLAYDPVWSPDGSRVAYVNREFANDEIYVHDFATGRSTQVTFGGNPFVYKQKPTWSPDGTQIAFKSNEGTLNFQIWLMNADGSNLRNISQSESIDVDPVWVK